METFISNICRIVGHEWRAMQYIYADQCGRCKKINHAIDNWKPRDFIKVDKLELGSEAIYDKDISN